MLKLLVPPLLLVIAVAAMVITDRPQPPADFTFVNRDVNTLDLQRMSWMQDIRVSRALFEGLVTHDVFTHDYRLEPGVAERWEVSDDGLTYTFHLRDDARWSNGDRVTSHDFKYSWRRAILPDTGCYYVGLFFNIEGSEEFYAWRQQALRDFDRESQSAHDLWDRTLRKFDEMVAIETPDDYTLVVRLYLPTPYFLNLCAFTPFFPVYQPLVEQYESPDPATGRLNIETGWTKPPRLISNGPFILKTWRFKRDMRLERNPHYWNPDSINIDSINVVSIDDPNSAVLAFETGAVDWLPEVNPPYRADIVQAKREFYREHKELYNHLIAKGLDPVEIDRRLPPDPRNRIHTFPAFATYWFNFNCLPTLPDGRDNPFHDPRVRRAFAMALDKDRIVNDIRRIGERVAHSLVPPDSIPGYTPPDGVPFDPAAARRLLAEAGYPGGRNFITVEILFNRDAGHDIIAQAAAKDWQENLGVNVTLAQKEVKVFRHDLKETNFIIARGGWYGDYNDPTTFLELNRTGDGNNDRAYSNPEYDALLDRAREEPDPDKRMRILEEAEAIIMNEHIPMVPVFHYSSVYMFDPHKISGISPHPLQEQQIFRIDILGDGKGADEPRALPPRPRN